MLLVLVLVQVVVLVKLAKDCPGLQRINKVEGGWWVLGYGRRWMTIVLPESSRLVICQQS